MTGRTIAVAAAVALSVAVVVGVAVTLDRGAPAPVGAQADPAASYGRRVHGGDACDTRRGDMVIDAGTTTDPGAITDREDGVQRSNMKPAAVGRKSPDTFEVKYTSASADGEFVDFAAFQLEDPATPAVSGHLFYPDAIWRKCPA